MSTAPLTLQELEYYDVNAPLFGFMGAAFALIFSNLGAAYGTGKSGMGISALGVAKPELVMKSIVPVRLRESIECARGLSRGFRSPGPAHAQ